MDNEYQVEEWRDIEGYEGLYQISNLGRVKSFKRKPERIMTPSLKGAYLGVSLRGENGNKSVLVHVLVARAYIGIRPDGLLINHIDSDKHNNCADNLEYVTRGYNTRYEAEVHGKRHGSQKLTKSQVLLLHSMRKRTRMTIHELSEFFGITEGYTWNILHRKSWKYLPELDDKT